MSTSTTPDPTDRAEVAFHPPVLLGAAVATGFLLRRLAALAFLPTRLDAPLGAAVVAGSLVLVGWAMRTMHRGNASIPTREPTDNIVVGGPFRYSRNPIYLSMLLLLVGCALWANSLWFVILAAITAVLLTRGVIVPEERYLERKFGAGYTAYKRRVRRWR